MSLRFTASVLIALAVGSTLFAQTTASDPIRELLVEVRGLRAAMERSATIGARIQLLVARVQLQEQRIAELSRRTNSVRSELRGAEEALVMAGNRVKETEDIINNPRITADERSHYQHELATLKTQVEIGERRRQELTTEVNFLGSQLANDQSRWTDFNTQLDELERSLIQASKPR